MDSTSLVNNNLMEKTATKTRTERENKATIKGRRMFIFTYLERGRGYSREMTYIEWVFVCVRERERGGVSVCMCEFARERDGGREGGRETERKRKAECDSVCERERERESSSSSSRVYTRV